MCRIIFKDKNEFFNTLYGDEDDCTDISIDDIKKIIEDKLESLELIYSYLDESDYAGAEQYDLGDCENLIELFKNIEFENIEEEEIEEELL